MSRYCQNIIQILSIYCQKLWLYIVQILSRYCPKHWLYIVQIFYENYPDIFQIFSKYCLNIFWILWKYCQNIEQISYFLISVIKDIDTWIRKCLLHRQRLCSHWAHMTKPCALIGQLRKVLKMTFQMLDFSLSRCQPSL